MIEAGHFQEVTRLLDLLNRPAAPAPAPADADANSAAAAASAATGPRQTFLFSATLMLPPAARETHAKRVAQHKPLPSGSAADSLMQKVAFLNPLKACHPPGGGSTRRSCPQRRGAGRA